LVARVHRPEERVARLAGFGRTLASETELPRMLVNLV
jgi:hypothetical protein